MLGPCLRILIDAPRGLRYLESVHDFVPSIVWWFSKIAVVSHNEYLPVNQLSSPLVERQNLQKKELSQTRLTSGFVENIHSGKECANNSPKATKNTS